MTRLLSVGIVVLLVGFFVGDALAMTRVGEEIVRQVETRHPYEGPGLRATPERVTEETLHYLGATYIAVHFEKFQLADGDHVIVRSPDGTQSWRYEGLGRAGMGMSTEGFWAVHIKGDTAVVELFSRHEIGVHGYTIDRFARGYTPSELLEENPAAGTDDEGPDEGPDEVPEKRWMRRLMATTSTASSATPSTQRSRALSAWLLAWPGWKLFISSMIPPVQAKNAAAQA